MLFGFSRRNTVRQSAQKSRRPAPKRRRLTFDSLEDRRLLSSGSLNTTPAWTAPAAPSTDPNATGVQTTDTANQDPYLPVSYPLGSSTSPRSVAAFGDGSSVVAWADQLTDGNYDMMFQQYDALGNTIGSPTMVAHDINQPATMVAAQQTSSGAPGDFVVVWSNFTGDVNQGKNKNVPIYSTNAEVFQFGTSTSATPVGSTTFSASYTAFSVAMDGSGNFDLLDDGPAGWEVQSYNSSAIAQGSAIAVAGGSGASPNTAAIAMDPVGDFAVAWGNTVTTEVIKKGVVVSSSSTSYVYAEKFLSSGTPVGQGVITVEQGVTNVDHLGQENVAMDATGDFVVTWCDSQNSSNLGSLYASVFNASGISTTGATEEVTAIPGVGPSGNQSFYGVISNEVPAVVATGGGAFDLAWTTESGIYDSSNGTYTDYFNVDAQPFNSAGVATQSPITVYQSPPNPGGFTMGYASAAVDANSDLLVVYSLNPKDAPYTGNVFAQFYLDPPAPTTSSPTATSPAGTASPSRSSTAATDAVFAAYAYLADDDTLA